MKTLIRKSLILLLAAAAAPAMATAPVLTPHTAEYKVKISILGGRLSTRLELEKGAYSARHVIEPTGLSKIAASGSIDETSEFDIVGDAVRPQRYRSKDELTSDKTDATMAFDWDEKALRGSVNGLDASFPIDGPLRDRVSIQYQMMRDLKSDSLRDTYLLYDIDEIKVLEVRRVGTRRIETAAGTFDAVGIQHQTKNSSRTTTLWCVEALDYLPVVIEQHRKGKLRLRATLSAYVPLPDAAPIASEPAPSD